MIRLKEEYNFHLPLACLIILLCQDFATTILEVLESINYFYLENPSIAFLAVTVFASCCTSPPLTAEVEIGSFFSGSQLNFSQVLLYSFLPSVLLPVFHNFLSIFTNHFLLDQIVLFVILFNFILLF